MKYKRLKSLAIALFAFILAGSICLSIFKKNCSASKLLSIMTPEERYYLDSFFHGIFLYDSFYYVLFGSKPIAFTSYSYFTPFNVRFHGMTMSHLKFRKGFDVFRKYEHYYSSPNIIVQFFNDEDGPSITMINKKNFFNTFNQHKSDFEQILGPEITSENAWAQITNVDNIECALMEHEALLGILLGFGRSNAWLFHNRRMAQQRLYEFDSPIKRMDLIEDEISTLDQQLQPFHTSSFDQKTVLKKSFVSLPDFAADPSSQETQELREKYGKEREKIMRIVAEKNLLEVTLEQLICP